jgi:hypothetical protein
MIRQAISGVKGEERGGKRGKNTSGCRELELPCFDGHVGVDYGEEEDPT